MLAAVPAAPPQQSSAQKRERYSKRLSSLRKIRGSWEGQWRELSEFVQPRHFRLFSSSETNRGEKRWQRIVNNTGGIAVRTLAAGMMAGITSPARPWFRLSTEDAAGDQDQVKEWLALVSRAVLDAFAKSNVYKALHELYGTLGVFGTGVMILEADTVNILRAYTVPVGEFSLAVSDRGQIDTLYRETSLSVEQVVRKFGYDNCTRQVRDLYDRAEYDHVIEVVQVIEPRRDRDAQRIDPKNLPWSSCWFERGAGPGDGLLSESGYSECPILAPRWTVVGNDVYGTSPAMEALGDVKALQRYEADKALVIAKLADPPMGAPTSLLNRAVSLLPGEVTYFDKAAGDHGLSPLVNVPPGAVQAIQEAIREHEARIKTDLYADLWLMLSEEDRAQPITAREVSERHEEKMLQLGPVMERLDDELLDPMVERAIGILARAGKLPPLPKALKGRDIRAEYVSIMAQAQKMISAGGITQLAGFVTQVAGFKPEALDKINADKMLDEYADALGANPELIVPDDQVAQVRAQRAKAQQAQAQQQNLMAAAQAGKTLSQADTGSDNALTRALGPLAGAQAGGGA